MIQHEATVWEQNSMRLLEGAAGERRAVIDIGTNSVKLLVADVGPNAVLAVLETSHQTRLGAGFYTTRTLQPAAIANTAATAAQYVGQARGLGAQAIRILATSAARDARNGIELADAVRQQTGLPLEIITGEVEADLAFRGVTTDAELRRHPLMILDVGGGSTEFILGAEGQQHFRQSFPIGAVRLLERATPADPPSLENLQTCRHWLSSILFNDVAPLLQPSLRGFRVPPVLVGTGGTATILGRIYLKSNEFNREQLEAVTLPGKFVREQTAALWKMTLADRKLVPGIPPNRADVILMGTAIYREIMEFFGFPELRITTRGLRFGAMLSGW